MEIVIQVDDSLIAANNKMEALMEVAGFTSTPEYLSAVEALAFNLSSRINSELAIKRIREENKD